MNKSDIILAQKFLNFNEQQLQSWYSNASDTEVCEIMEILCDYESYLSSKNPVLYCNSGWLLD